MLPSPADFITDERQVLCVALAAQIDRATGRLTADQRSVAEQLIQRFHLDGHHALERTVTAVLGDGNALEFDRADWFDLELLYEDLQGSDW